MDSSEARSCAVLGTIRIKVAISGSYLLRDALTSLLMAPPIKCVKKKEANGAARRLGWDCIIEECFWQQSGAGPRSEKGRGSTPRLDL